MTIINLKTYVKPTGTGLPKTTMVKSIQVEPSLTVGELQKRIATELNIAVEDMLGLGMKDDNGRTVDLGSNPNAELTDLRISNKSLLTAQISISPVKNTELYKQKLATMQAEVSMKEAQKGLIETLDKAFSKQQHVVITVGSYLNTTHDPDSLRRQQFPTERLGDLNKNEGVHFIHIDSGFKEKGNGPMQFHEQEGWELVETTHSGLVSTYTNGQHTITTIAKDLVDPKEIEAYFGQGHGQSQSILNVPLNDFMEEARQQGTGFVTGNFYSPTAQPVNFVGISEAEQKKTSLS